MPGPTIDALFGGLVNFDTDTAPGGTVGGVLVDQSAAWVQVCVLQLGGNHRGALIEFINGAGGALGHLKLTRASVLGGHALSIQKDWKVDSALNPTTPTSDPEITSADSGLSTLAAGASGFIHLDHLEGVQEIGVWAEKATTNTNLRVVGSAY